MIVLIDNYDSFTFNLVHYLGDLGAAVRVHRNDKVTGGGRDSGRSGRDRAFARPVHAQRGRHLPRPDRRSIRQHSRSSASASAIRRSATPSAAGWCGRRRRCTASSPRSAIPAPASSAASTRPSRRRATIRSWSSAPSLPDELTVTADTEDGLIMGLAHRPPAGARRAIPSRKHRLRARPSAVEELSSTSPRPGTRRLDGARRRRSRRRPAGSASRPGTLRTSP